MVRKASNPLWSNHRDAAFAYGNDDDADDAKDNLAPNARERKDHDRKKNIGTGRLLYCERRTYLYIVVKARETIRNGLRSGDYCNLLTVQDREKNEEWISQIRLKISILQLEHVPFFEGLL